MKTVYTLLTLLAIGIVFQSVKSCVVEADEKEEALRASRYPADNIAPVYTERMSGVDQRAMNIAPTTDFKLVDLTETQATFLATRELSHDRWSCSFTLDLQTLEAIMRRSYNGEVVQAKVKFTPNQYGGFDLDYKYEDGRTANSSFIPVWNPQPEGLTVGNLTKGILDAIGRTPVD